MSVETADSAFHKGNSLFVDELFEDAMKYYNTAIELEGDNAEFWVKRSACHFQLKNFAGAISDATKAIQLDPKNHKGYYRKGVAAFAEEEYESAKSAFEKGLPLAPNQAQFKTWIRKCQAEIDAEEEDSKPATKAPAPTPAPTPIPASQPTASAPSSAAAAPTTSAAPAPSATATAPASSQPRIRHEWFQTETHVTVSIFVKNARKEDVSVDIDKKSLNVSIKNGSTSGSEVQVDFDLADNVVPQESKFEVLSTKIEVKLKKEKLARWKSLEDTGNGAAVQAWDVTAAPNKASAAKLYPSSKGDKNWDKIGADEPEDKLEGDAALNKVFKDIYSNASEEQRRAMMKSFYESGGTVLSTNWDEVGKAPVKGSPPDGLEMHKWNEDK